MNKRPTITDVASGYQSRETLDGNFDEIAAHFDNFLSRTGDTPNQMEADLDMNSNDVLNATNLYTNTLYVNGQPVTTSATNAQDTNVYSTRGAVQTATIDSSIPFVVTTGYSAAGDGGGAIYTKVDSEPSHEGKIQSANGVWYELDRRQNVFIEHFGGFTDSSDCSTAINNYIAYHDDRDNGSANTRSMSGAFPVRFADPQGTYTLTNKVTVPSNKNAYFYSPVPGGVRLKYTGSDPTMVLFDPKSSGGSFGAIGVVFEGGNVAVVGAVNGQAVFTDCIFSHAERGLWFTDSFQYYDSEYPAYDISAIVADNPLRLTVTGHPYSDGDRVALVECEGEERINSEYDEFTNLYGRFFVKFIDANTIELYRNSGLSLGYDASSFTTANFTSGKVTEGHTFRNPGTSDRNTVHFDLERCSFISLGIGLIFESSTYALFTARKLRFNFIDGEHLVLDASGVNLDELEFIGVEDRVNNCFIHLRCRHNPNSEVNLGHIRTGPEEATATDKDYNTSQSFFPPDRSVIIGPKDGSAAKQNAACVRFRRGAFYGDNTSNPSKDTDYAIDVNARLDDCIFDNCEFRNIITAVIKETATAAGRTSGDANILGFNNSFGTSTTAWFSGDGDGWINLAGEDSPVRGGTPTITANSNGVDTANGGTATASTSADNEMVGELNIVTGSGSPSGSEILTFELSRPRNKNIRVFLFPSNNAAMQLNWRVSSQDQDSFILFSSATLAASTTYKLNYKIFSAE